MANNFFSGHTCNNAHRKKTSCLVIVSFFDVMIVGFIFELVTVYTRRNDKRTNLFWFFFFCPVKSWYLHTCMYTVQKVSKKKWKTSVHFTMLSSLLMGLISTMLNIILTNTDKCICNLNWFSKWNTHNDKFWWNIFEEEPIACFTKTNQGHTRYRVVNELNERRKNVFEFVVTLPAIHVRGNDTKTTTTQYSVDLFVSKFDYFHR